MSSKAKLGPVNWQAFKPAPIIGVDEVGRGCLAGPVVAAAVILNSVTKRRRFFDSKQLSESRREELLSLIQNEHQWALGFASPEEIDRINIYHASLLAMRRAVQALKLKSGGHVLVDGNARIPDLVGFEQTTIVKGDARVEPIAAASIVAKVTRDRMMHELGEKFPDYGFEVHKGYPTEFHRQALAKVGPCSEHRRSFNLGLGPKDKALEARRT